MNHTHDASQITSGTLPLSRGGTGVTTLDELRGMLSVIGNSTTSTMVNICSTSGTWKTYDLPVIAQYCTCRQYGTSEDVTITIGRSSYSLRPSASIMTTYGNQIAKGGHSDKTSGMLYTYTYALLSLNGNALWLYNEGNTYLDIEKSLAILIYY